MPARRSLVALLLLAAPAALLPAGAAPAREPATTIRLAKPERVELHVGEVAGIVNGSVVTTAAWDARWRAMVALGDEVGFRCGGTLIDARTVVTAAHCVHDGSVRLLPSQLQVAVGRHDLEAPGGEVIGLERVDVHPSYDAGTMRNDLAALRLASAPTVAHATIEPLAWHDTIWPQLGQGWAIGSDLVGPWIAGWGVTNPQQPALTGQLREAKVPVHSDAQCGSAANPGLGWQFDRASMICAGIAGNGTITGGGVDACQGDSGGPLLVGDGAGTLRLVGVTSWGSGCASDRWGAWTRVGAYTAWLDGVRFAPPTRPTEPVPLPSDPTPPGTSPAPPGAAVDTTAPSVPGGLRASSVTASTATISWRASSDDRAVERYELQWHTGRSWSHFSFETATRVAMRRMTPGGLYRFRVRAFDTTSNDSAWSTAIAVRMLADRIRPTRPGAPRLASSTRTSATLAWAAARDNVEVRRYVVWRLAGRRWVVAARPARARVTIGRLAAGSLQAFRVQAVDTAGNRSLVSATTRARLR